jgi:hypothetical protein
MTCGITAPILGSNIPKELVFGEKKSYFLSILKVWNPCINHMTTILKGLIGNKKIDGALK